MAHIGIFDTGFGGHYVAEQLKKLRPKDTFTVITDTKNLPYGSRTNDEIIELTTKAIQPLVKVADCIIIACNTASTIAIDHLRSQFPKTNFIGFEPMIKPAAQLTKTNRIAILATPATLKSQRYRLLKEKWAKNIKIYEPDCSSWALNIESKNFNISQAKKIIIELSQKEVDVISLSCTHYLYLKNSLQQVVENRTTIIDPLEAINNQINQIFTTSQQPQ